MCQYIDFISSARSLYQVIPNFRLIACRNDDGYKDGVIQIDGNEYAYYDNSRDHVFFLGTDWDEAIDQVWILDKWQEPEGWRYYTFDEFEARGLEAIRTEVRSKRPHPGPGEDAE
jgi:hypothetical protein